MDLVESNTLGQFFSVNPETIIAWIRRGMPKEENGKFNLLDCVKWRLADLQEKIDNGFFISRSEIAEILGYNEKYINKLEIESELPKEQFNKYDIKKVIRWFVRYKEMIHQREVSKIKEGGSRERLERGRAELLEIEIAIKHGALIDSRQLEDALNNEVSIYIKGLEALKTKLANLLNLNAQQKEIIEMEISSIRNQIGNLPADKSVSDIKFI